MKLTEKIRAKNYILKFKRKNYITNDDIQLAIREFNNYRNITDFMVDYVVKYKIAYMDIPSEFFKKDSFLIRICNADCSKINEVYNNLPIEDFYKILSGIIDLIKILNSRLVSGKVKSEIKRYIKVKKTQITNKNTTDLNV